MQPRPELQTMVFAIIAIGIGLLTMYLCHKLIAGAHETKARKVLLALESAAVTLLFVSYFLGEVMHISQTVTGPQPPEHFGLSATDYFMIFGTLATSMVLYFSALWGLKKLGDND